MSTALDGSRLGIVSDAPRRISMYRTNFVSATPKVMMIPLSSTPPPTRNRPQAELSARERWLRRMAVARTRGYQSRSFYDPGKERPADGIGTFVDEIDDEQVSIIDSL